MNNGFMGKVSRIIDTVVLCLLWLICSLPVFTLGAASSALYYAFHKAIRQEKSYPVREFFSAFRNNFKQAVGVWTVYLVFILMSVFTCWCLWTIRTQLALAAAFLTMGAVLVCLAVCSCIYSLAYLARFENSFKNVMKNSLLLTVSNLQWSVVLLLLFGALVIVSVRFPPFFPLVAAAYIWLKNRILEKIFRKIMTQEEREMEITLDRP